MIRCLLVDDDAELRRTIVEYLGRFGVRATPVADAAQMRQAMAAGSFDVVLLDLMLPDEDGLSLCRWLRASHPGTHVVMVTAQGDPTSRVVGLELGADDYIAKPFDPRELVARIKAVIRRTGASAPGTRAGAVRSFAGWRFDTLKRELVSAEQVAIPLSTAEFRLLMALVDHPRRVLSRNQLLDFTRGPGVIADDRSIDLAVSRLRQKLGASASGAQLIATVRGEGYVFDPDAR